MNTSSCSRLLRSSAVAVLLICALSSPAWAQNRYSIAAAQARRQQTQAAIAQTKAQLQAAQQALAAATVEVGQWQAKVSAAQGSIEIASESLKGAKSELSTGNQRLREIEESELSSQPADSPFGKAKAELAATKEAMERAQSKIFATADFKAKLQEASQGEDKAEAISKLKQDTLKADLAFQKIKVEYETARTEYDRLRLEILQKNSEWTSLNTSFREARGEEGKSSQKVQSAAMHKATANSKLRDAQKAAALAQANVQQLAATLRSLEASIGKKPANPSGAPEKKKPKK